MVVGEDARERLARGGDIEGFYVLKSAFSKVANNGKPFLNLTLSDRTGAVDAKVWSRCVTVCIFMKIRWAS